MKTIKYNWILILFLLLASTLPAQVTPEGKIVITQPCEICDDEQENDEDGDGHANCDDLECILQDFSNLKSGIAKSSAPCEGYDGVLLDEIEGILENAELISLCDPEKSADKMLNDALINCGNGCTRDELFEELAKNDDYVYSGGLSGCPRMKCVWDVIESKVVESELSGTNEKLCQLMGDFINSPFKDVELMEDLDGLLGSKAGRTLPNEPLLGMSKILINSALCSSDSTNFSPVESAGTIIHEFIHAEIYNHLYVNGFITATQSNLDTIWEKWVESEYGNLNPPTVNQHQLMAQFMVDRIANLLHQLNGGIGMKDDYLYVAWEGLFSAYGDQGPMKYNFIPTPTKLDSLRDNYVNNVRNEMSSPFFECWFK